MRVGMYWAILSSSLDAEVTCEMLFQWAFGAQLTIRNSPKWVGYIVGITVRYLYKLHMRAVQPHVILKRDIHGRGKLVKDLSRVSLLFALASFRGYREALIEDSAYPS